MTTDFIAEYQQGFSDNTCDFLVEHFDKMPRYENFINGEQAGTQQQFIEASLNANELAPVYAQVIKELAPSIEKYLSTYYQVVLAGLSLEVYHPVTGAVTALTTDNFQEVGLPQIGVLMRKLFRIAPTYVQKSEQTQSTTTCFHSDSFPKPDNLENLHRILTITVFLNDIEQGGGIEFSEFDKKISAQRGKVVIFPAYFTHAYRQLKPQSTSRFQLNCGLLYSRSGEIY